MSLTDLCLITMAMWGTWHSHEPTKVEVRWTKARLDGYCGLYLEEADAEARARMEPYRATLPDVLYAEQDYMLEQIKRVQGITFSIDGLDNLERLD